MKSPVHALFTIFYDKFSFNQVFRSKTPCGFAYRADFCRFLCASHRSWWGGTVAIAAFSPPPAAPAPHSNFSLNRLSLTAVGWFAHKYVGDSAHMPWGNVLQKGRESKGYIAPWTYPVSVRQRKRIRLATVIWVWLHTVRVHGARSGGPLAGRTHDNSAAQPGLHKKRFCDI